MTDTLLIAGLIESNAIKSKYKYSAELSDHVSIDEIFGSKNISVDDVFWRKYESGPSSGEKVNYFDYPGETLWPKKRESTLTEVLLKTILRDNGFYYKYLDINEIINESEDAKSILNERSFGTVSLSTAHIHDRYTLIRVLRIIKKYCTAPIILGGRYISDNHEQLQEIFGSLMDYAIQYDGEEGYIGLLKCLSGGGHKEGLSAVPNLIWKNGDTIVENAYKTFDINKKLYPDWSLAKYGKDYIFYEAARGCNFRCRFCTYWMAEKKFIYKSADTIFDEWVYYYKQGIKTINIYDSTFAYPPERLIKLCKMLIRNGIRLRWTCYSRSTDIISKSMAKLMAKSGCGLVSIGIESGSNVILENMNKNATVKDHKRALQFLEDAGIVVQCGFVVGFPGETEKTVQETYEFIINNKVRLANIQAFTIRSLNMLILAPKFRESFDIKLTRISQDDYDWKHKSMDLGTATKMAAKLRDELLNDKESFVSFRYYLNVDGCPSSNPYLYFNANVLIQRLYHNKICEKSLVKENEILAELFDKYFVYGNKDECCSR